MGGRLGCDLSVSGRGGTCLGASSEDSRTARRDAQSGEDPDCAHLAWLRVSRIQNPTWERQIPPNHDRIKSKLNRQNLYAIPTQKSVDRFKDQIRTLTQRRIPLRLGEVIETINPIIRGWGNYYCRSHVRRRFNQLDRWLVRRLWSQLHQAMA